MRSFAIAALKWREPASRSGRRALSVALGRSVYAEIITNEIGGVPEARSGFMAGQSVARSMTPGDRGLVTSFARLQ